WGSRGCRAFRHVLTHGVAQGGGTSCPSRRRAGLGTRSVPPQTALLHISGARVDRIRLVPPGIRGARPVCVLKVPVAWGSAELGRARKRRFLPSRSYPHSSSALSRVGPRRNNEGMSQIAHGIGSAAGDPHQLLVDAVRDG